MRENFASNEAANAFARVVLPVPGTSSMSTCPSAINAVSSMSRLSCLPRITLERLRLKATTAA